MEDRIPEKFTCGCGLDFRRPGVPSKKEDGLVHYYSDECGWNTNVAEDDPQLLEAYSTQVTPKEGLN